MLLKILMFLNLQTARKNNDCTEIDLEKVRSIVFFKIFFI